MTEIKSYIELYNYLQSISLEEFKIFISITNGNVDNYEASFKLFSYLKLFNKFDNFKVCNGNYNTSTLSINNDIRLLLDKKLGGKNDKSDITLMNNKTIIATTCKNRDKYGINDLDIRDLSDLYNKNYKSNNYELILCIIIPNKEYLFKITNNCEKSSNDIKKMILENNTIILDYNDIYDTFNLFKFKFSNISIQKVINLYNTNKELIKPYLHQKYSIIKTLFLLKETDNILWGHLPRSGKTYIMGSVIYEYSKLNEKSNYLIITTSPTETIPEYLNLFNNKLEFDDFNIITKEDINDKIKPKISNKNIVIVSKQYLQSKTKDTEKTRIIKWLKDMSFNIRFIDESHNGGTTELAKTTLDTYGNKSKTIYITATYIKPVCNYNISSKYHILWDLEDNELCKNIRNDYNYNKLINKYGELMKNTINEYDINNIIIHYNNIPKLHYITWKLNDDIKNDMIDDGYGFSIQSILMLKNDGKNVIQEFVDENKVEKLIKNIFGYEKKKSYSYYDKNSFMGRIKNIIDKPEYNSRWFSKEKPLVILAFLPCGIKGMGIYDISETLRTFIIKKELLDDFEIICMNSETYTDGKNPNKIIEETEAKAKNNGKIGVLVLTGKKCSLGITIKNCDIVLLLTNIEQYDTIFQMLYRCMTDDNNKRNGFVIDLNIQRCVNIIMEYAIKIGAGKSSKDSLKYILEQKLVEFNIDEWNDNIFGVRNTNIDNIITKVYNIFTSKSCNCIDKILENIDFKIELFSKEDQQLVNSIFNINKNKIAKNKNLLENEDTNVPDGIKKTECNDKNIKEEQLINKDKKEEDINIEENIDIFNQIIKKLIPLLALITICINDISSFDNMIKFIKENEELKPIVLESIITWWGKKVEKEVFNIIIMLYDKYFKDNISFNNKVADIRDIFRHNLDNKKELSKSIDKFLIPHENEKKQNAEISTPFELRQEMINKIPDEFWETPKKVFEPCSGKCGFLLDIIDKFMEGLNYIEDKEERYQFIVEECLYFSDINKQNIFIANLLLNPYGKYKLNYNEGDTLKLNIKEKWGIDGFDAVIGNPPYQESNDDGRKALNHNLWSDFINYSFNLLYINGYLLFITPNSWMSPTSKNNDVFYKNYIIYLNISECEKWFNVGSKFSYYLIEKTNIKKETDIRCIYKKKLYDSKLLIDGYNFLPMLLNDKSLSIIKKFYNNNLPKVSFKSSSELHNTTKKNNIKDIRDNIFKYPIRHTTKRNIRYSNIKHSLSDKNKILMNLSGNLNPIYDDGKIGFTQAQMYLLINNNKYIEVLNSKLYRLIFEISKWSGFNIEKNYHNIPYIENEKDIYKLLNITNEELEFIDNYYI